MPDLLPIFLNLTGRAVLLVGGGRVAAAKLGQLLAAGANVRVVAPHVSPSIVSTGVEVVERAFVPADAEGAWLVAAATPDANREVAAAAEVRRVFVNAVDDPVNATAFLSGVVRRGGVTLAISTGGDAPALASLLREALDAELPEDLAAWTALAQVERVRWRRDRVPMDDRKPQLLRALNELYDGSEAVQRASRDRGDGATAVSQDATDVARDFSPACDVAQDFSPAVPWMNGPEDSWL